MPRHGAAAPATACACVPSPSVSASPTMASAAAVTSPSVYTLRSHTAPTPMVKTRRPALAAAKMANGSSCCACAPAQKDTNSSTPHARWARSGARRRHPPLAAPPSAVKSGPSTASSAGWRKCSPWMSRSDANAAAQVSSTSAPPAAANVASIAVEFNGRVNGDTTPRPPPALRRPSRYNKSLGRIFAIVSFVGRLCPNVNSPE